MNSLQNIPAELKKYPNWVVWRYEMKKGRKTKVPYNAITGRYAKPNDSRTWNTFQQVENLPKWADGIGFMFSETPFVGIDIDHCLDGGKKQEFADSIADSLTTYTEVSPSGEGLHLIGKGYLNIDTGTGIRHGMVEIYDKGRYFTITGNLYHGHSCIKDIQAYVTGLTAMLEASRQAKQDEKKEVVAPAEPRAAEYPQDIDSIIARIRRSSQAALFSALYDQGDVSRYGGDDSAADMALMNILPFWTGGNEELMLNIFNGSALAAREKWQNREDYRQMTIKRALADWNGAKYDPKAYAEQRRQEINVRMEQDSDVMKSPDWPKGEWVKVGGGQEVFKPIKAAWENTKYLLDFLGIRCRYNRMRKEIDFTGQGLEKASFDAAITYIRGIAHQNGLKISRMDLQDNLGVIAEQDSYSPACDYLLGCQRVYDGKDHIAELWDCLVLAKGQDNDFCYTLFKKWLISCVKLAFNDGSFAAQGILILKGPQGIGKTRFLYKLLPVNDWGADGITLDPNVKDDVLKVSSCWIVELGEFGETLRKERLDSLKQFITQRGDKLRRPYGRVTEYLPRTTAFLGTVNDDRFLKDSTGERRYWVIALDDMREDDSINMVQVWGQVMKMAYVDKVPSYLTAEELETLNRQNSQYKRLTDEELIILDKLNWDSPVEFWQWRTVSQVCEDVGIYAKRVNIVGRALRNIASRDPRVKIPTNNMDRRYLLPPERINFSIQEG